MWEVKLKKEKDNIILSLLTALDVINQCEKNMYPNINGLLKVFIMLPSQSSYDRKIVFCSQAIKDYGLI